MRAVDGALMQNNGVQVNQHGAQVGVLAAIGGELGQLKGAQRERLVVAGVELGVAELGDSRMPVLTCVCGVGKVRAAAGAAALIAAGASEGLVIVGLAGGLMRGMRTGDRLHCGAAQQIDSAIREDRRYLPDPTWLTAWRAAAPGPVAQFLTADRPVLNPIRRTYLAMRYARAGQLPAIADMETAAAAAVAARAGVRWAALRVLSDLAGFRAGRSFRQHFAALAGQSADTLKDWLPSQFD